MCTTRCGTAKESIDKFERYAREHVGDKVDLIWASGTPAATAAQNATASIPVVFALVGDPVYSKLVRSLQAPGANLTGMSLMISEMWEKRVEILTEIFPKVQRIGVLYNPLNSSNAAQLPHIQQSAQQLGKEVMIVGVRTPEEFGAAFAQLKGWQAEALLNAKSTLFLTNKRALLDGAAQNRGRLCTPAWNTRKPEASSPTVLIMRKIAGAAPPTWIRYSRVRSRVTWPCNNRSNLNS